MSTSLTTEERMEFPFPRQQEAVERIVAARVAEALAPIEALVEEWEGWRRARTSPRIDAFADAGRMIRAAMEAKG